MTKKLSIILASFAMVGYIGCTDIPGFPLTPVDGGSTGSGGGSTVDPTDSIPDRDPWGGDTVIIGSDTLIIDDHGGGRGGRDDCDSVIVGDTLIIDDHGGDRGGRGGRDGRGPRGGRGGMDDGGDDGGSDSLLTNG